MNSIETYYRRDEKAERLLSREEAIGIVDEIKAASSPSAGGRLDVWVFSYWANGVRWARNNTSLSNLGREIKVRIGRSKDRFGGGVITNQTDSESVVNATRLAEKIALEIAGDRPLDLPVDRATLESTPSKVWSDGVYNRTPSENAPSIEQVITDAEARGFLAVGYLESYAANVYSFSSDKWGRESTKYHQITQAQFSSTVRHPKGTASGWAGSSAYDFSLMDLGRIASVSVEKCIASLDPVRLEPGRYTTILEPAASNTFFSLFLGLMNRVSPESGGAHPFLLGRDFALSRFRSKLGLKIIDERISLYHNPADSATGLPEIEGLNKVTLVDKGVLKSLFNYPSHSFQELYNEDVSLSRASFTVPGTDVSMDEMISSTSRGLIVTRFSNVHVVDDKSVLFSGFTRDGLWLVENGKITKAVRNFKFTESPLFILNNLDTVGISELVWNPTKARTELMGHPAYSLQSRVVPSIKVKDFSFTSTIDAI